MKRALSLLLFALGLLSTAKAASAATWYVRPDGGTRYSSNMTLGQCDGLADAAYPGSGQNRHCAFKDVRYLYQDGSYATGSSFPAWGWVIAGGDTVLLRGSIGTGVSYRIGWNNPNNSYDPATQQYWGLTGDPYSSLIPPPPSGTAAQHTKILGENYASCSAASAKTQIHGGYGLYEVLSMAGSSYVDIACLDITDFSECSLAGGAKVPCSTNIGTLTDHAKVGIVWTNQSTNDTLTNVHIHGLALDGMNGPVGDGTVFRYLDIIGNSMAGWDSDNGTVGKGTTLIQNFNISWNGCTEEYPIVDSLPYTQCSDDSSGGYGDGFGTATVGSTVPWNVTFDQGVVSYNTQDGLDALHLVGAGSSMTITRVLAYGNMGQQIKIGGGHGAAQNDVIITNCNALRDAIPGTPSGYNTNLSDFCRAADTGVLLTVMKGSTTSFDDNTVYSASATGIEVECDSSSGACDGTSLIDFRNNIFLGFVNNPADGYTGRSDTGSLDYSNPIYDGTGLWPFGRSGSQFSNNIFWHGKSNFNCASVGQTSGLCADPVLTDETWHNYGYPDVTPLSGSPAIGSAISLASVALDFNGATRGTSTTIGAINVSAAAVAPVVTVPTPTAPTTPTTPTTPTQPSTPSSQRFTTQSGLTFSKGPTAQIPLILTASVVDTRSTKVPTGAVLIYANNRPVGAGVLDAKGSFNWTVPALLAGQNFYAAYAGDTACLPSLSPTLSGASALVTLYGK